MFFGVFFALAIILLVIRLAIFFTKFGVISAVVIDFLVIGGFSTHFAHNRIIPSFASGKAIYFWDVVVFIFICTCYAIFLAIVSEKLPKFAKIIHYTMAWIGMGLFYIIIMLIISGGLPQLLDNETANYLLHLTAVSVFALILFKIRLQMMEKISTNAS